jgi:lipopolysaccharide biosynthesis glycosyltransferase
MTSKIRKLTLKNRKNRFYNYGSQPPLALAIGDQFEHLSPAWNVKVNKLNLGLLGKEKACLYHWSGKRKPWNTKNDPDIHEELWRPYSNENITK